MYDQAFTLLGKGNPGSKTETILCWLEKTVAAGPQGHVYSSNRVSHMQTFLQFPPHFLSWADSVWVCRPQGTSLEIQTPQRHRWNKPCQALPKDASWVHMVFLICDPRNLRLLLPASTKIIRAHSTIHLKVQQPNMLAPTSVHCALSQNHRILELEREVFQYSLHQALTQILCDLTWMETSQN